VLTYEYDTGGTVNRATGRKGAFDYTYLARLDYDKFGQRLMQDTGTGVRTTYTYDAADRTLATLQSRLPDGFAFQNITYQYDDVGNVLSLFNNVPLPHGKPIGGPSLQTFAYDDLYRLTSASGQYRNRENKEDRYSLGLAYDTIHNVTAKHQRHEIDVNPTDPFPPPPEPDPTNPNPPLGPIEEPDELIPTDPAPEPAQAVRLAAAMDATSPSPASGTSPAQQVGPGTTSVQEQRRTTYDYDYAYNSGKPHAPSATGPVNHAYDANGNLIDTLNTLPPAPGKRRQLVWDENNRLACNQDHNRNTTIPQDPSACGTPQQPATVRYVYDDAGNRVIKEAGPQHIYPNRNFSERNGTGFKHVWIGESRIATKTVKADDTFENHHFFFHADHVGSSGYVTDEHANLTEHIEYFPFGETWVNEHPAQPTPVPYQYGAKELDEETGLYYYGARYYNPRTQLWQSPDPALDSYLDGEANAGVFEPVNLDLYGYSRQNPVTFTDPNGEWWMLGGAAVGGLAGLAVEGYFQYRSGRFNGTRLLAAGTGGAVAGFVFTTTLGTAAAVPGAVTVTEVVGAGAISTGLGAGVEAAMNGEDVPRAMLTGTVIGGVVTFGGIAAVEGAQVAASRIRGALGATTRLPQDIAISLIPGAPRALPITGRSIGRPSHDAALQAEIRGLPRGATDIRVNQQQVNAAGQRVGINRPDLQYTLNGQRYYVEFEGVGAPRGAAHRARIIANDPSASAPGRIIVREVP